MFVELNVAGKTLQGMPNVYINPYRKEAEVFIDDFLLITYEGCEDVDEALNRMVKEYKVKNF